MLTSVHHKCCQERQWTSVCCISVHLATQGFGRSGAGQALLRKPCGDQSQQLCVSSYARRCRDRDWWPDRRQFGCVLVQRQSKLTNSPDRCRSAELPI